MRLDVLLKGLNYTIFNRGFAPTKTLAGIEVSRIAYNSSKCNDNSLFVCIKGARVDGHDYANDAYNRGARVIVCERELNLPDDCLQILSSDTEIALAVISANWFNHPETKIKLIGITGTKGKTSCSYMIAKVLNDSARKTAIIGTCGVTLLDRVIQTDNTTPGSLELYGFLNLMANEQYEFCVIEVSSQAIKHNRIFGLWFDYAVFTNLSPDHIGPGEHESFEEYKEFKKQLFSLSNTSIINIDDDYSVEFTEASTGSLYTYSVEGRRCSLTAHNIYEEGTKTHYSVDGIESYLPMLGKYSVSNALASMLCAKLLDIPYNVSTDSLKDISVPGRFQIVDTPMSNVTFIIDYAHNGDSMEKLLSSLKPKNRLICLFGSVGGRTQIRRKELALAASKYADFCIITSDNPNNEPPENIAAEIARYLTVDYIIINDRKEAIKYAVSNSEDGDIVVFAGKGHEKYQLINCVKEPFDEESLIKGYAS
ncbi:MAG: UDP-N-acetylmuramoyl-L-alanyl-D-glutamate--2,6-diaminopimelate ligase [Clostridiales bacterium]|nr:UDP-N-acetylmuramoyl-L-alanyl-D-glutamate--2,6-diaminopimelate ligase [Clostridiales bacterium]